MEIKASYLAIAGGIEATRADALLGILKERGRGFAADSETWAELRLMLETIQSQAKAIGTVHSEMWASVKDRNDDAFSALLQEFERSAARLSGDWARISVMAKIALEDPELPPEPTREEQIEADRERLFRIRAKRDNIMAVLPYAQGELATDLVNEANAINAEEGEILARLPEEEPEDEGADEMPGL